MKLPEANNPTVRVAWSEEGKRGIGNLNSMLRTIVGNQLQAAVKIDQRYE